MPMLRLLRVIGRRTGNEFDNSSECQTKLVILNVSKNLLLYASAQMPIEEDPSLSLRTTSFKINYLFTASNPAVLPKTDPDYLLHTQQYRLPPFLMPMK